MTGLPPPPESTLDRIERQSTSSGASTPISDHAHIEPAPERDPITLSYKRFRERDPYVAAISDEAYIAPHHVLTLTSKATRLGQSIYHAGARSFNQQNNNEIKKEQDAERASVRTVVSVHLPNWMRDYTARRSRQQSLMPLLSFQNPWSSFNPPGISTALRGKLLRWGLPPGYVEGGKYGSRFRSRGRTLEQTKAEMEELEVKVRKPKFETESEEQRLNNIRITWLGHATTLVQLPNGINILFDPIFVHRASPSQQAGPHRFTPPPCKIENLPDIDIVCISHNHYDHLSWECMKKLRKRQKLRGGLKVFCPLGNVGFFREAGFAKEDVAEMDWWDKATVHRAGMQGSIEIWCTPAQHGSGRSGRDQGISLWSSWMVLYKHEEDSNQQRIFFAGDTGLRSRHSSRKKRSEYPVCPIFREISLRLGIPQIMLLPISVGSSLSYFRSWDPFPRRFSPFPRVESGMTSAIHMDSEDAAECHAIMSLMYDESEDAKKAKAEIEKQGGVVSLAVHFGVFIRNDEQTREDVRDLRKACKDRGIAFVRPKDGHFDRNVINSDFNAGNQQEQSIPISKPKAHSRISSIGRSRTHQGTNSTMTVPKPIASAGHFLVSDQGETIYVPIN
ncbi:hypothetical protein L7F22_054019 [Adiantum nelumboides]|nr:hypothetical protein [Adiantum nelumboides]